MATGSHLAAPESADHAAGTKVVFCSNGSTAVYVPSLRSAEGDDPGVPYSAAVLKWRNEPRHAEAASGAGRSAPYGRSTPNRRQRRIISDLEEAGQDTTEVRRLLTELETARAQHMAHQEKILSVLETGLLPA